jgi:hypothetical protein
MNNNKLKHLVLLSSTIFALTGCTTVLTATPAMGANDVPAYWLEVVNGPHDKALEKARALGVHLCKGHGFHIAREIEQEEKLTYLLRVLVQCEA